jgi:hypothetical protein
MPQLFLAIMVKHEVYNHQAWKSSSLLYLVPLYAQYITSGPEAQDRDVGLLTFGHRDLNRPLPDTLRKWKQRVPESATSMPLPRSLTEVQSDILLSKGTNISRLEMSTKRT